MVASTKKKWRQRRDPLWRGDAESLTQPDPSADAAIVRHILFLDGPGRRTPYHSTTESPAIAHHFAGANGKVYETYVAHIVGSGVRHISQTELKSLLKGKGHGDAKWPSAFEVSQARRYAEQHLEHLLSFTALKNLDPIALHALVNQLYR